MPVPWQRMGKAQAGALSLAAHGKSNAQACSNTGHHRCRHHGMWAHFQPPADSTGAWQCAGEHLVGEDGQQGQHVDVLVGCAGGLQREGGMAKHQRA